MGLNIYRADVIIPAMKIFTTAAKICRINEIFVPKIGVANGLYIRCIIMSIIII